MRRPKNSPIVPINKSCVEIDNRDFSTFEVNVKRLFIRYGDAAIPITAPITPPTNIVPNDKTVIPNTVSVKIFLSITDVSKGSVCIAKTMPMTLKSNMNITLNIFSGISRIPFLY